MGLTKFRASAPGRCGIVGNPSDIYGGCVLSCSIPLRAYCSLTLGGGERLPDDRLLWDAATGRFPLHGPATVEWASDVPRSSGLAGSTALLAATVTCAMRSRGEQPLNDRVALAETVRDIERHDAGIVCGFQDAYMAVFGGLQLMDFAGKSPEGAGPVARLTELDLPLPFLLVTTGVERLSGSVHGPMVQRWLAGEHMVRRSVERIGELGRLGAQALHSGDLHALGEAMTENHRLVAEMGGSGDAIDLLISDCTSEGALGAKLAGAGLGGTVIALGDDLDSLEAALRAKGYSRFIRPEIVPGLRFEEASGS